ncbi:MAG: TonB-dependent receptor [Calditrichaeota bacterium]|nr:TonB-dependent receptor [Calditrichota bacterium]
MKGSTFKLLGMIAALALVVAGLSPAAMAGTTGKIAGKVVDAATGDPLPGANVIIEGTQMGAATDENGEYFIINVPPGLYTLRAQMIGYSPVVQKGVRVSIDLTTTVNFSLQQQVVEGKEVVVTAQRPIVQPDISGTERNIDPEELSTGRYQNVANVVTAQVGVDAVSAWEDRPGIRGSSLEESQFIVDGVPQTDPLVQRPYYRVNLDAVQEIKLQTGGFSARYGNLRSGLVNVVTKEGGPKYHGSVNFQYSPPGLKHFGPSIFSHESPVCQPFTTVWDANGNWDPNAISNTGQGKDKNGDDISTFFEGWNNVATQRLKPGDPHYGKPQELYARWLWRHRSKDSIEMLKKLAKMGIVKFKDGINPDDLVWQEEGLDPDYRADVTFGGPVPFLYNLNKTTFFVSYYKEQTEYAYPSPERDYHEDRVRAKITTWFGKNLKVNLGGFYSYQKGTNGGQGPGTTGWISMNPFYTLGSTNKMWYLDCQTPGTRSRYIYNVSLTHTLSQKTYQELRVSIAGIDYGEIDHYRNTAPMPGTSGLKIGRYGPVRNEGMPTSGGPSGVNQGNIGTEAYADSMARAGAEGWDHWRDWALIKIGDYWYDEAPKGYGPINWRDITGEYRMESCNVQNNLTYSRSFDLAYSIVSQVTPHHQIDAGFQLHRDKIRLLYERIDPSVNGGSLENSKVDGELWGGIYAQDKMEFSGFVANVGLRADWIRTADFPMINVSATDDTVAGPWSRYLLPGHTLDENGDYNTFEVIPLKHVTKLLLSPRLGISHPISDVAKLFFNYGHMYQWPSAYYRYRIRYDTRRGNLINQIGNPGVAPPRTIQYELGYEHNLFNKVLLRVTSYYKDVNNEIGSVRYYPLGYGGRYYYYTTNIHFRDIRGLEAFLELRPEVYHWISGWASLNYMVESGGSFGYDRFYEDPSRQPRQVSTEVSKPDVRPVIKLNLMLHSPQNFGPSVGGFSLLGGIDIGLLYNWKRGRHFTWNPAKIPLVEYNMRWKPYQRWDLRFQKELASLFGVRSYLYIDVINLFNNKNMTYFSRWQNDVSTRADWAWDGHKWWKNQVQNYLYSLGYTSENENTDGTFKNTTGRPGDNKGDLPGFTPWLFLEKRDVFFGIRLYF